MAGTSDYVFKAHNALPPIGAEAVRPKRRSGGVAEPIEPAGLVAAAGGGRLQAGEDGRVPPQAPPTDADGKLTVTKTVSL